MKSTKVRTMGHKKCLALMIVFTMGMSSLGISDALAVTKEEIITLTRLGIGKDEVIKTIEKDRTVFELTVQDILQLRRAGVHPDAIKLMLESKQRFGGTPGRAPTATPTPTPPAAVQPEMTPEERDAQDARLRLEAQRLAEEAQAARDAQRRAYAQGVLGKGKKLADEGKFVQQLTDGSYIVLGNTEGGAGAQSQVFLNTISSAGASVLTRTMGGSFDDKATSLMQTDDGGFVFTGQKYNENTGDNIWIVKLTPTLTTHWDKVYGGDYNDKGSSIKQTDDGGYIITGSSMSVVAKQSQIILLKIEEDGCVWSADHKTKIACGL